MKEVVINKILSVIIAVSCLIFLTITPMPAEGKEQKPKEIKAIPSLIDIGAKQCIPCKMMAPILEELKKDYDGILRVEFIDAWENPNAGQKYGIRGIPTQIFYDASGKELYRHLGFFSKEQILATFKKHGVEIRKGLEQKKR